MVCVPMGNVRLPVPIPAALPSIATAAPASVAATFVGGVCGSDRQKRPMITPSTAENLNASARPAFWDAVTTATVL